jgi:hypothetical protein
VTANPALGAAGGTMRPVERQAAGLLAFYTTAHHELMHQFRYARFGSRATPPSMVATVCRDTASEGHSGFVLEGNHLGGILKVWWQECYRWDWRHLHAIGVHSATSVRTICGSLLCTGLSLA